MARRNGHGMKELHNVTEKFRRGEQRLLRTLEDEGLISAREREGLLRQLSQAASNKRTSEVLSAAHTVHNKIVQVLRRGKGVADPRERTGLEILYEITHLTQTVNESSKLFDRLLELIEQAVPFEHATIFLVHRETKQLSIAARRGEVVDLIGGVKFDMGYGFSSWVAKQQKPVLLNDLHRGRRTSGVEVGSFLSVPLVVQGELIGVLNLSHPKAKAFHDDHLRMLILVAGQSAGVIQRFLMYEEMARLAITDDLTGLCNRRHFLERVNAEIDRARRYDLTFSLAMLDIDHFKVVNDTHGHGLGDRILSDLGRLLRKSARSSDLAARYGGEEFVVMMPMTAGTQAQLAGERLREMVAAHTFPRRKKMTVSVGLAGYPEDATTLEELLRRADAALYEAKRSGRNCVMSTRARLAA